MSYQYTPLPQDGHDWIRLLRLEPGQWSDPLVCSLSAHRCEDIDGNYIALSYVWGLRVQDNHLLIQPTTKDTAGAEPQEECSPFPVTDNLFSALRRIRDLHSSEHLVWADAVCINQEDNAEKSRQVANMGELYREGNSIFCWLGEKDEDLDFDLGFLDEADTMFYEAHRHGSGCDEHYEAVDDEDDKDDWMSHVISDVQGRQLHMDEWAAFTADLHRQNPAYTRALLSLSGKQYFTRQWIQQEVCLGWESATVCLGGQAVSLYCLYRHLVGLGEFLNSGGTYNLASHRFLTEEEHMAQLSSALGNVISFLLSGLPGQSEFRDLRDWLESCSDLDCGQAQDKIFGLLTVAKEGRDLKERFDWPDYSLDAQKVYTQAATHVVESVDAPGEILNNVLTVPRMAGLPSWVPDWSQPAEASVQKAGPLKWRPCTAASTGEITSDGEKTLLHVPGATVCGSMRVVDTAIPRESIAAPSFEAQDVPQLWRTLTVWWKYASKAFPAGSNGPGGKRLEEAFGNLLLTQRLASRSNYSEISLLRDSSAAAGRFPEQASRWLEAVWRINNGRRLAIVNDDISLVPEEARTDDVLAILSGAEAVCVLGRLSVGAIASSASVSLRAPAAMQSSTSIQH